MTAPVTLITGTRKGIGKFLAQHYLEAGHSVIGCSRQPCDLQHPNYRHHCCDVSDEAQVQQLLLNVRREHGCLHNLINNAGVAAMNHCMLTPATTAYKVVNTNLIGTFLLCREGAKIMHKHGYGRIVNFTSVAVPLKLEGEAIYAASKAALISLTQILAKELAPYGITVNAVGPTPTDTDLIRSVPKDKIDSLIARQALPRMGRLEDVANVVDFFLRAESSFVTGQTLFLGGV
jgi:3-oxoacyl-[acyl-carrier protein] reductase